MRTRRLRNALLALSSATALAVLTVLTTGAVAVDVPGDRAVDGVGQLAIEAFDKSDGKPLPVRVRISPRALLGEERVWVDRHGRITGALPHGSYRVSISHGPEWSIVEAGVAIESGKTARIRVELERAVDADRFTGCDLHVHTAESPDSNLSLAQRIDTLLAEDVQFAVLTDHNRVTQAVAALAAAGIATLPGVEVTTWAPELGHFNVFPRATAPRYKHTHAAALLRELRRSADSFVQINHPRLEGHIGYFELAEFERKSGRGSRDFPLTFDGIEVWNGYDLAAPARRDEVFRDWLAMVARGQHITATGNSDSHRAGVAPFVGYPRTYVRVPRKEAQLPGKVLAALKQGRAFVTNGPILDVRVRGKGPGETVTVLHGERVERIDIDVQAPAWMALREAELWLGERRVRTLPIRQVSFGLAQRQRLSAELPLHDARSLVVTVRGEASMKPLVGRAQVTPYAFTNPIWLARH